MDDKEQDWCYPAGYHAWAARHEYDGRKDRKEQWIEALLDIVVFESHRTQRDVIRCENALERIEKRLNEDASDIAIVAERQNEPITTL